MAARLRKACQSGSKRVTCQILRLLSGYEVAGIYEKVCPFSPTSRCLFRFWRAEGTRNQNKIQILRRSSPLSHTLGHTIERGLFRGIIDKVNTALAQLNDWWKKRMSNCICLPSPLPPFSVKTAILQWWTNSIPSKQGKKVCKTTAVQFYQWINLRLFTISCEKS